MRVLTLAAGAAFLAMLDATVTNLAGLLLVRPSAVSLRTPISEGSH